MVKKTTGLRIDESQLSQIDAYLEQLKKQPGRGDATQADAIRTLIDHGLAAVAPKKRGR